ncbi:hypothetical protein M405DRAFT_861573 [Rhizopogon salebrosus TDB-379]|nr:hypothetical protein M405DRAFT_861573 [Rhizopogon salebrosus TDB-379]
MYPPCPLCMTEQLENISHTPVNFQYDLAHTQSHPCTCAKDHSSKNNLPTVKGRTTTLPDGYPPADTLTTLTCRPLAFLLAPPTCCTLKQPSLLHPAAIR